MASPDDPHGATSADDATAYLDMPPDRRAAARANAALLSRTADRIVRELPFGADVDDFRRVLIQAAPKASGDKGGKP